MTTAVEMRPTYQPAPPMTSAEFDALKLSIERHGVLLPVLTDEEGNVIDGHHRRRACEELGIEFPTEVIAGLDDHGKRERAVELNVARRHLTIEQKREAIVWLRNQGLSQSKVASTLGVTRETVRDTERRENGETPSYRKSVEVAESATPGDAISAHTPPDLESETADHKQMAFLTVVINYPCRSDEERTRNGVPYRQASERRDWTLEQYLTTPIPRDAVGQQRMVEEIHRVLGRELARRPLKTAQR